MNQLRSLLRSFFILLVISFLSSCEEELSEVPLDNEIEEARDFFEENVDQSIDPGSRSRKSRRNIRKNLDWDNAWIKREPNKVSVIVPLDYDESLYTHKNGGVFDLSDWTYAMIIKERGQKRQALIVTSIPDQDFLNSDSESPLDFSGLVLVEDWKGNLVKALQHKDGEIREVSSLEVTEEEVDEDAGRGRVMDMNDCTIMDWFVCVGNEQIGWNCTYSHSEYLCPVIGGGTGVCFYCPGNGDEDPPPPGGGSTGDDPVDPTLPCIPGKVRNEDGICVTEEDLWEQEICENSGFLESPCLQDVWNKLKSSNIGYNTLKNFLNENPAASLCLNASSLGSAAENGNTLVSGSTINVTLNLDRLNRSQLSIARTLLHELIHAELYRKVKSVNSMISPDNFPGIYDYYRRFIKNWQHQQMAAHYVSIIADGLAEYDNNQNSRQLYEDIAWVGLWKFRDRNDPGPDSNPNLIESEAWKSLTISEQDRIKNSIATYQQNENKICE